MRKRNVNHLADTIFWYLIYFLPVIAYFIAITYLGALDFETFFSQIGFGFVSDNLIVSNLADIFGSNGILPLFSTNAPFIIFSWFICTFICHLFVDFLLFIPRLCHKWLEIFCGGDE